MSSVGFLQVLGHAESLAYEPWPEHNESLLEAVTYILAVQVIVLPLRCWIVQLCTHCDCLILAYSCAVLI